MELSFCELRAKEVVNVCDGKRLGNIIDLVFDSRSGVVTGIVVPFGRGLFSILKSNQDIFIPYNRIIKIGKDVILVELTPNPQISAMGNKKQMSPTPYIESNSPYNDEQIQKD